MSLGRIGGSVRTSTIATSLRGAFLCYLKQYIFVP